MTFLTALGLAKAAPKKQSFEEFDSSPMYETTVDKGPHVDGIENYKTAMSLRHNPVAPPTSSLDYRKTMEDELCVHLENITSRLRHDVLDTVAQIRRATLNESQQHLDEERQRNSELQTKLSAQVTSLQGLASAKSKALDRHEALLERILDMFLATRARYAKRDAKGKVWGAWLQHTRRMKHVRARVEYLQRLHATSSKRTVLTSWRLVISQESYERKSADAMEVCQRKFDGEALKGRADLSDAVTSLAVANHKLLAEQEERCILEERLRAAFLRGVVALNNEALGVLRGGVSGVSPPPPSFSPPPPPPPKVVVASSPVVAPRAVMNPKHPMARKSK